MPDNSTANAGAGGDVFATDDIVGGPTGNAKWPFAKLAWGPLDTANVVDDAAGKRVPVKVGELPNPANTRPRIEAASDVDVAGTATPIKFVRVNATADGDNTVVAGVASKKLRVLGYVLTVTAAGLVAVKSSTTTILAELSCDANGGASYAGGLYAPAFETAAGEALVVNTPVGVDAKGHVTYIEV